ncbi:ABC transporter ATP-binding protein [Spelaeicoccus albus]|uniref:Simple sugar transport system ATP-binding protein n=1 Tax=Spelaeicoccus albus TaxID=1280376 RepID=A0A7Z0IJ82_9MICO|nr:ABC transporter ATP-binding protein [Spelaeicoccus albus]NYI69275.1 simple sugar transport system ATP-binding protein [Spelaeicoccus albus]
MKLELKGITKRFGSLVANDHIDVTVEPGEIHCLLGENGAGKSTLMNVLYGLYQPDGGQILVDGKPVSFGGPGDAMAAGIGMVHQHFMLIPVFTVAENVILGNEPVRGGGFLDLAAARKKVREISDRYNFNVDPDALIEDLPVGVQQRVEIIKALVRDARVLILDEPTAVLTPQETDELIDIMRQLADSGTSIVFITHKLREVRAIAHTITVIRLGAVVGQADADEDEAALAAMMVGRSVSLRVSKNAPEVRPGEFTVKGLTIVDDSGTVVVDDLSMSVRGGEILAVAGVQGNGQTELSEAILGLRSHHRGSIVLDGKELLGLSPAKVLASGVGFVPEDRSEDGLVGQMSIADNLVLDRIRTPEFASGIALKGKKVAANAGERIKEFDIRAPGPNASAGQLSGGNQQKVVMARELSRSLKLFLASQPTRGVDVGSIEFLHKRLIAERDRGTPVVIVSTELDEVLALADRIAVMYRGKIVGIVNGDVDRDVLGLMMAGASVEQAEESVRNRPATSTSADEIGGGVL